MLRITAPFWIRTLCLLFGVLSGSLYAATASVTANKVVKDEVFQLRITAEEQLDADAIDFSALKHDFYMGRPNFGSYTNYVNGVKSVRSEWSITLAPLKTGTITIPAFQVGSDATAPIQLTVTADANAPDPKDLVEFQIRINRQELYPGESVQLDTRLLIKTELRRLKDAKIIPPDVEGADKQAIELTPKGKANQYQSILNGVEVTVVDQRYDLVARQTGKFIINGPQLRGAIIAGQTASGNARLIPITTQQELLVIDVLDKPQNYQGTWLPSPALSLSQTWRDENGNKLDSETTDVTVHVGSPVTREITLTAEGVEQTQLPDLQVSYPDQLRRYAEKPVFRKEENRVIMTIKQVLIPKQAGEVSLPDVSLPWWNTREKRQATAKVKGLRLTVKESDTPALNISSPQPAQPVREAVKTKTVTVSDPGHWPYLTALFAALWLLFTGLWIRARRKKPHHSQPAAGEAPPTLTLLTQAIKQNDTIQAQTLYRQWKEEYRVPEPALIRDIEQEMALMMAAAYAPSGAKWDNNKLLQLLTKAAKVRPERQTEQELAPL